MLVSCLRIGVRSVNRTFTNQISRVLGHGNVNFYCQNTGDRDGKGENGSEDGIPEDKSKEDKLSSPGSEAESYTTQLSRSESIEAKLDRLVSEVGPSSETPLSSPESKTSMERKEPAFTDLESKTGKEQPLTDPDSEATTELEEKSFTDTTLREIRQDGYNFICQHPTMEVFDMEVNGKKYGEVPFLKITCRKNNTFMLLCDGANERRVYGQYSVPQIGFRGFKKISPLSIQALSLRLSQVAKENNIDMVRVILRGFGPGREYSLKGLQLAGLRVLSITDDTRFPNGRAPSRRRV